MMVGRPMGSNWKSLGAVQGVTTNPETSPTMVVPRAGRLITQALQATRFARALVEQLAPGTDRLIVWRTGNRG